MSPAFSTPAGLTFPTSPAGNANVTNGWPTGPFTSIGTYAYTITCNSVVGATPQPTVSSQAKVEVTSTVIGSAAPVVTITASPNPVQVGQTSTLTWSVMGDISGAGGGCTKTNGSKSWKLVPGNNNTSPGWTTGTLNAPGSVTYTFSCTGPGGTDTESVTVNWVAGVSAAAPTVSIYATPPVVQPWNKTTINWSSNGTITSCTKSNGSSGWPTAPGNTDGSWLSLALNTEGLINYTISCTGPGGTASASTVVTVSKPAPVIDQFTISEYWDPGCKLPGCEGDYNTRISWHALNATSCLRSGPHWTGTTTTSGTQDFVGVAYSIFILTCTGSGGTVTRILQSPYAGGGTPINIAPSVNISATPTTVLLGGSTKISWDSGPTAISCKMTGGHSGWTSVTGVNGGWFSPVLNTAGSTTYTVTCKSILGLTNTASVTVTVFGPSVLNASLGASSTNITAGQTARLFWSASNASTCSGDYPISGMTGTNVETEKLYATKTFKYTCIGIPGAVPATLTKSVTVTVN